MLITGRIGEATGRDREGGIDSIVITAAVQTVGAGETEAIREAAIKSLCVLHRCRILHNDVDLRNLRVETVMNSSDEEVVTNRWRGDRFGPAAA